MSLLRSVLLRICDVVGTTPGDLPSHPVQQREALRQHYERLEVQYSLLLRDYEIAYNQLVQPQQREDALKLYQALIRAYLSVRRHVRNTWGDTLPYRLLVELKITPDRLDVSRMPAFLMQQVDPKRLIKLSILLERHHIPPPPDPDADAANEIILTRDEAIRVIQRCERGRQARAQTKHKRFVTQRHEALLGRDVSVDLGKAAVLIQRLWRGVSQRRKLESELNDEAVFLGMEMPATSFSRQQQLRVIEDMEREFEMKRKQYDSEYDQSQVRVEREIRERSTIIRQEMVDTILEKYIYLSQFGQKVPFPTTEEGGSLRFRDPNYVPPTTIPEEGNSNVIVTTTSTSTSSNKNKNQRNLPEEVQSFLVRWGFEAQEGGHDPERLRRQIFERIQEEIRVEQVDPYIRDQIRNLQLSEDPPKRRRRRRRRGRGGRGGRGRRGRGREHHLTEEERRQAKEKALLAESQALTTKMELLFSNLVLKRIIEKKPNEFLKDYLGTYRILEGPSEAEPSMSDLRRVVSDFILQSLFTSSSNDNDTNENQKKENTILFYGSSLTGKSLLSNIIRTELGQAYWFSLNRFEEIFPTNRVHAIRMILDVASHFSPSVLYLDNCETILRRRRCTWRKTLFDLLNKKYRNVVFVGNSSHPHPALESFFHRMVWCVLPDYASRQSIIAHFAERHLGDSANTLAYCTEGFTSGQLVRLLKRVLTPRRRKRLPLRPLSIDEFLGPLAHMSPCYQEEYDHMLQFVAQLPMTKRKGTDVDEERIRKEMEERLEQLREERRQNRRRRRFN